MPRRLKGQRCDPGDSGLRINDPLKSGKLATHEMRYFGLVQASARCGLGLGPTFLLVTAGLDCPFWWNRRHARTLELIGKYEFTSGLLCPKPPDRKANQASEVL